MKVGIAPTLATAAVLCLAAGLATAADQSCGAGTCKAGQTVTIKSDGAVGCDTALAAAGYLNDQLACDVGDCSHKNDFVNRGVCRTLAADGTRYTVTFLTDDHRVEISAVGDPSKAYWLYDSDVQPVTGQ